MSAWLDRSKVPSRAVLEAVITRTPEYEALLSSGGINTSQDHLEAIVDLYKVGLVRIRLDTDGPHLDTEGIVVEIDRGEVH